MVKPLSFSSFPPFSLPLFLSSSLPLFLSSFLPTYLSSSLPLFLSFFLSSFLPSFLPPSSFLLSSFLPSFPLGRNVEPNSAYCLVSVSGFRNLPTLPIKLRNLLYVIGRRVCYCCVLYGGTCVIVFGYRGLVQGDKRQQFTIHLHYLNLLDGLNGWHSGMGRGLPVP